MSGQDGHGIGLSGMWITASAALSTTRGYIAKLQTESAALRTRTLCPIGAVSTRSEEDKHKDTHLAKTALWLSGHMGTAGSHPTVHDLPKHILSTKEKGI